VKFLRAITHTSAAEVLAGSVTCRSGAARSIGTFRRMPMNRDEHTKDYRVDLDKWIGVGGLVMTSLLILSLVVR
jgi:hypothetical protein